MQESEAMDRKWKEIKEIVNKTLVFKEIKKEKKSRTQGLVGQELYQEEKRGEKEIQ